MKFKGGAYGKIRINGYYPCARVWPSSACHYFPLSLTDITFTDFLKIGIVQSLAD
jgi:hypothetical protein